MRQRSADPNLLRDNGTGYSCVRDWSRLRRRYTTTEIVFPDENSIDSARFGNDDFITATGTLTGEGVKHKNNAVQVSCYEPEKRCLVFQVEQIGDNQLGDIYPPSIFPISRWEPSLVVATSDNDSLSGYPSGCIRSTVNLGRESGHEKVSVEFVEEPINQADKNCQNTPNVVRKWTLEKPAFWKR
jgi:hypothetical protein